MEFYYYIPIVGITVATTIVGIRSYIKEQQDIKRRKALKRNKGTVHVKEVG
jgi:predicted small secreted protein